MLLDFKEIPEAHRGGGEQDTFELFSREFLDHLLGLRIIQEPGRGPDAGRDLIASEIRTGLIASSEFRWLISCKHKAHSGAAVGEPDEANISDRVKAAKCDGFMGIYSTLPSSALVTRLGVLDFEYSIFDREKIERVLLTKAGGLELAKRFFPASVNKYLSENPSPAKLFSEQGTLECQVCRKNLFDDPRTSLVCVWENMSRDVIRIYACCKGKCDHVLRDNFRAEGTFDGWFDLTDIMIPTLFLKKLMAFMNNLHEGRRMEKAAFEEFKNIMIHAFPFVARHLTEVEKEQVSTAIMIDNMGL